MRYRRWFAATLVALVAATACGGGDGDSATAGGDGLVDSSSGPAPSGSTDGDTQSDGGGGGESGSGDSAASGSHPFLAESFSTSLYVADPAGLGVIRYSPDGSVVGTTKGLIDPTSVPGGPPALVVDDIDDVDMNEIEPGTVIYTGELSTDLIGVTDDEVYVVWRRADAGDAVFRAGVGADRAEFIVELAAEQGLARAAWRVDGGTWVESDERLIFIDDEGGVASPIDVSDIVPNLTRNSRFVLAGTWLVAGSIGDLTVIDARDGSAATYTTECCIDELVPTGDGFVLASTGSGAGPSGFGATVFDPSNGAVVSTWGVSDYADRNPGDGRGTELLLPLGDAIYVMDFEAEPRRLLRVSPDGQMVETVVAFGPTDDPRLVHASDGGLWLSVFEDGNLSTLENRYTHVDPATGEVTEHDFAGRAIAANYVRAGN